MIWRSTSGSSEVRRNGYHAIFQIAEKGEGGCVQIQVCKRNGEARDVIASAELIAWMQALLVGEAVKLAAPLFSGVYSRGAPQTAVVAAVAAAPGWPKTAFHPL